MTLELFLAYVTATLIVLAIPGPTIMLVVSYALTQGRKSAFASVMGVGLGDATAAAASLMGLGAILATSATAFSVLKWVGAAYLVWLGIKMWRSRPEALGPHQVADVPARKIFWHAYVVTALNPKGIVFFMAFLPHFIAPQAPRYPAIDPAGDDLCRARYPERGRLCLCCCGPRPETAQPVADASDQQGGRYFSDLRSRDDGDAAT